MLDLQEVQHRLKMQSDTLAQVRAFFANRGFTEIPFTPLLVASPGMEPNLDPMEVDLSLVNPQRTIKTGLITSPEYSMKKLLGSGMDKIFTITPVFRNVEADGGNHGPEFLMLEWYAAGGYEDLMAETESLLNTVLGESRAWPRIPHTEANMKDGEPQVADSHYFVTEYPAAEASLARLNPAGFAERFEAYANGLELCNGFAELTDPVEQRRRLEAEAAERAAAQKTVFPIDEELILALSRIKKPVYGNALGLDRLIMLKYSLRDINQIQLFPYPNRYGITK